MHWLKENGITSNWEDYLNLPIGVLEDCRLLMDADIKHAQWEASRAKAASAQKR